MFEPIVGERQCRVCGVCKPETEFYSDGERLRRNCKACCHAAARARHVPKIRRTVLSDSGLAVVRQFYPQGGATACLPYLPAGITRTQVVKVANRLGLHCENYKAPHDTDAGDGWAVPMQDESDKAECHRLRNWRNPVQPRQLWGKVA